MKMGTGFSVLAISLSLLGRDFFLLLVRFLYEALRDLFCFTGGCKNFQPVDDRLL